MWWRFKGTSTARGYKREPFLLEYDAQPSMQRSSETKETNVSFRENSSPLFLVWLKANRWRKIILRPTRKGNVPPRETETSLEGWMERNGNLNLPSTRPRILPLSLFVCASHSDWSFSHSPSVFFFPSLNSSPVLSHCEISVIFKWTLCSHGFQIRDEYQSRPLCPLENEFSWTRTWRGERKGKRGRGKRRCSLNDHRGWCSQEPHFFSCQDKPFYTLFHPLPCTSFCSRIWFVTPFYPAAFIWYAYREIFTS